MSDPSWTQSVSSQSEHHIRGVGDGETSRTHPDEYNSLFPQHSEDDEHTRGRFSGKVAIVTGGASGIGRATVERFTNDGAAAAIFDINEVMGRALADELCAKGRTVKFYKVDVSNKELCEAAVAEVVKDLGAVNFLVNNAFYMENVTTGMETSVNNWQNTLSVNLIGTSNMTQACYPYMEKDGKQCAVVNLASTRGHRASPSTQWAYSSSKAAVTSLTRCMAVDFSRAGIRVNSVSPGKIWTPAARAFYKKPREEVEAMNSAEQLVVGLIESSGVASVIVFLCSHDARYIDGSDIAVDAGTMALGPSGKGK